MLISFRFYLCKNINNNANIWLGTEELSNVLFWKLSNCSQILQQRNCDETVDFDFKNVKVTYCESDFIFEMNDSERAGQNE